MEAIEQGAATNSQGGENVVAKSGDPYPLHGPPLDQQPSMGNISFHSPIEGHVDDTTHPDYGPNASFWIPLWDRPLLRLELVQPLLKKFHQMKKNIDNTRKLFFMQENLRIK